MQIPCPTKSGKSQAIQYSAHWFASRMKTRTPDTRLDPGIGFQIRIGFVILSLAITKNEPTS